MRTRRANPGRAFTLVELLVTIGVIVLLLGLLLPGLGSFRSRARTLHCQNNLRQLGLAAQMYVNVHSAYPAAVRYENTTGQLRAIEWDYETVLATGESSPGPIMRFTDTPEHAYSCPDFDDGELESSTPFTGYNYNTTYIGGEAPFPSTGWDAVRRGIPLTSHHRTTTTALFGDAGRAGGTNKFMRAPGNTIEGDLGIVYAGGQAFRHTNTCNVCFLDGHVNTVGDAQPGEHATDALLQTVLDYPGNGFLSNDDDRYDPR